MFHDFKSRSMGVGTFSFTRTLPCEVHENGAEILNILTHGILHVLRFSIIWDICALGKFAHGLITPEKSKNQTMSGGIEESASFYSIASDSRFEHLLYELETNDSSSVGLVIRYILTKTLFRFLLNFIVCIYLVWVICKRFLVFYWKSW